MKFFTVFNPSKSYFARQVDPSEGIKGWGLCSGPLPSKYNHDEFVIHLARYTFRPGDCNFRQETQNTETLHLQLTLTTHPQWIISSDLELE